ncbi:hypothetical protein MYX84_15420 [Acidobacteria bacterium AH-259-O06]|nr:hypothetical protein [Acidobacteria bacterium AH-259-O06]
MGEVFLAEDTLLDGKVALKFLAEFLQQDADGDAAEVTRLWTVPSPGGDPTPITDGRTNDRNPTWSTDGRKLFFVSNRGGTMDLWQQRMGDRGKPVGEAEPVTTGLVIHSAVFSSDGAKLAYSRGRPVANVWRVPIRTDRAATWGDARQITFDNALVEFFDVSPEGKRLVVSGLVSGREVAGLRLGSSPLSDTGGGWRTRAPRRKTARQFRCPAVVRWYSPLFSRTGTTTCGPYRWRMAANLP